MLLELKVCAWIRDGLATYQASPELVEVMFSDDSSHGPTSGVPVILEPGVLTDPTKRWIPHEWIGGALKYGGARLPILDNTRQSLVLDGDPSLLDDPEDIGYHIAHPESFRLNHYLATHPLPEVTTSWARVPTIFPAITVRLQTDALAQAYVNEGNTSYVVNGIEHRVGRSENTSAFLLKFYGTNRDEALWFYALVANHFAASQDDFATWGLSQGHGNGSDLDPTLEFAPEPENVRHLLLTVQRPEYAAVLTPLEYIRDFRVHAIPHYARLERTEPLP